MYPYRICDYNGICQTIKFYKVTTHFIQNVCNMRDLGNTNTSNALRSWYSYKLPDTLSKPQYEYQEDFIHGLLRYRPVKMIVI